MDGPEGVDEVGGSASDWVSPTLVVVEQLVDGVE